MLAFTMNRGGAFWSWISNLCPKLSNSGNTLKLMIPNYNRKYLSGQNNYLGKVTTHKISENKMGNRGSKSGIMPVKEQRVDDSWFIKTNLNLINLRCTLMDFERYYQVKILSKQLKFKRNFSTLVKIYKLNPWFVTGFVDGEESFGITNYIDNRIKDRLVWAVKPSFQISLNSKDRNYCYNWKNFLDVE